MRKDLDAHQQLTIIKLKGSLISKGYTEIIHILDHDNDFHINTFETAPKIEMKFSNILLHLSIGKTLEK